MALFEEGVLDDALGGERRVALKFGAPWCSMCDDLDRSALSSAAGEALFAELETLRVDFDAAPALAERFAILELPTLVVLRPDGLEVGRVVGFDGAKWWLAEARVAVRSDDPIPKLRAAAEEGAPKARLALGEALLSREPDEGVALLEGVSWGSGPAASQALWVLGRFHHRVRKDPATARFIWQQLALRWPGGDHGGWWWYATAQAELGHVELGSEAFEAWVALDPKSVPAITEWARFCGRRGYEPARGRIREATMAALASARGADRDTLEDLVMILGQPF